MISTKNGIGELAPVMIYPTAVTLVVKDLTDILSTNACASQLQSSQTFLYHVFMNQKSGKVPTAGSNSVPTPSYKSGTTKSASVMSVNPA